VFFASIVFSSLGLLEPVLSKKSDQLNHAKTAFSIALHDSYENLRSISYELIEDTNLKQNIEWGLVHSVGGILSQYTVPGSSSHIQIMDDRCELVAAPRNSIAIGYPCTPKSDAAQGKIDLFFWTKSFQTQKLNLLRSFTVKGNLYYLFISQDINLDWVNANPKLSKYWEKLSLHLVTDPKNFNGHVLVTANGAKEDMQLMLTSSLWPHSLLPFLFSLNRHKLSFICNAFTIIGFIGLLIGLALTRLDYIRFSRVLADFYRWSKNSKHGSDGGSSGGPLSSEKMIQAIRRRVDDNQKFYLDGAREKNESIERLNQTIQSLELENVDLQKQLHKVEAYRSLQTQFAETGQGFLELQKRTLDKLETINDTITHVLSGYTKSLGSILQKWQSELTSVHPRKFLRSLSERINPITQKSDLDSDLEQLMTCADQIKTITIQTAIGAQSTLEDLLQSIQAAEHLVSVNQNDTRKLPNLAQLVHEGQNLIPMTKHMLHYRCENLIDQHINVSENTLPYSIWSSVVYHTHMAIIHAAKDAGLASLSIQTQVKKRVAKTFLVISSMAEAGDLERISFSEKAKSHLQIARQLVANAPVSIIELPTLSGLAPLAIVWDDHESNLDSRKLDKIAQPSGDRSQTLLL
jgi:hypothetical protein